MMATQPVTKEAQYEKLLQAISGGDFGMAKYLWEIISQIHETDTHQTESLKKFQQTIDAFIKDYKIKDGINGKDGKSLSKEETLALLKPYIPKPKAGKDGKDGLPGKPGKDGVDGFDGKPGKPGAMPLHEWDGTKIRFQTPTGWGEWVDLRGPIGPVGQSYGPAEMGGMSGLYSVRGDGFERQGVADLYFGANLTLTRTGNGVRIDAEASGAGGSGGIDFETPTGTVDDSNLSFTVLHTPIYLVVNGAQYFENVHYTLSGLNVTLNDPIGSSGFIRSAFGTGVTVENPTGTVDDSNVTFTVAHLPKYVVVNGAQYFDGAGYTYAGGTITLNDPVGTGGFIRSVY